MKTYEGTMTIKWYKNDHGGDRRPLTIDTKNRETLQKELMHIRNKFLNKGENGNHPFSIKFNINERK